MTRTLKDYRPQHDDDCLRVCCGACGYGNECIHESPCRCGLDALLAECAAPAGPETTIHYPGGAWLTSAVPATTASVPTSKSAVAPPAQTAEPLRAELLRAGVEIFDEDTPQPDGTCTHFGIHWTVTPKISISTQCETLQEAVGDLLVLAKDVMEHQSSPAPETVTPPALPPCINGECLYSCADDVCKKADEKGVPWPPVTPPAQELETAAEKFTHTIALQVDEDGDVLACVLEFPGCMTHGATIAEALRNLTEGRAAWEEMGREAGVAIPKPFDLADAQRLIEKQRPATPSPSDVTPPATAVEQAKADIRDTMQQVRFWPLETVKARLEAQLDALVAAVRQESAAELETERMRLAACTAAALGNTPASVSQRIAPGHPYYSATYGDVCRAVDAEMAHHERAEQAEAVVKAWRELRAEEVRVWGPVKIDHAGRCGTQTNALMDACEKLALAAPRTAQEPGTP